MEGLPKILVILYWCQTDRKTRNPEAELQGPWTELKIGRLIIGSDNIFNIEVRGALAIMAQLAYAESE